MGSFLKSFFASLLALIVFVGIIMVMGLVALMAVSSAAETKTGDNAVLVIDLSQHFAEVEPVDPIAELTGNRAAPALSSLVRLIRHASTDKSVRGIYLKAEANNNDFGAGDELRSALADFRAKGKFVYAYGDVISQRAYYVASVADRIYCNPTGSVEWHGLAMQMPFIKGALEKLEVEPQIFYAGKFKSATEPLREKQMTEANREQSRELLSDFYSRFLAVVGTARKIDTAMLRKFADSNRVQFGSAAVELKMIDGLRYDDQVKDEIRDELGIAADKKINFITPAKYADAVDYLPEGEGRIAVIYAEGTIVTGKGDRGRIGSDSYREHIRKAREDKSIKAIVIRVNSGGGSAMASEVIWREVMLARKAKPVIVSFGDVAASGGYYMACAADSIFAQPNTITGSIGVFSVVPNMQQFFDKKLGVTFDEVKTGENAIPVTVTRPLSAARRQYFQNEIDTIYRDFLSRVANGRNKPVSYIDSIAQGRIWSGTRAVQLGLVDRLGGIDDAIAAAAKRAGLKSYRLREYPGRQSIAEMLLGGDTETIQEQTIKKELGREAFEIFSLAREIKASTGKAQARMPFKLIIE